MDDWLIERLHASHERDAFCCGKGALDEFLKTRAGQYERKGIGRTFVAVLHDSKRVLGYYTLAAGAIPFANLPKPQSKKLPKHPVPVILLGRLAVDQTARRRGLGEYLLFDAFERCLAAAEEVGAYAVEVQAIDEEAQRFYKKYGFVQLPDQPLRMFLPIETIRRGLSG
jgi:GNAT superfamily N-acetyltransferase